MQTYTILSADGTVKGTYPGEIASDGTVRIISGTRRLPIVNKAACEARGLIGKDVAEKMAPVECLAKPGLNEGGLRVVTSQEYGEMLRDGDTAKQQKLESVIPGVTEAIRLSDSAYNESERYSRQFEAMMTDEDNDGARPPRAQDQTIATRLKAHLATRPEAALYLQAKNTYDSTHWADNTGKGASAKRAMEILETGGTVEEAKIALAVRREFVD